MGILNRLFGGEDDVAKDFAEGLTQALAEAFADDPDVQVYAPMNAEETIEFLDALKSGEITFDDEEPEEESKPWWKLW